MQPGSVGGKVPSLHSRVPSCSEAAAQCLVVYFRVTLVCLGTFPSTHVFLQGHGDMLSIRSSSSHLSQFRCQRGAQALSFVSNRMAAPVAAPGETEERHMSREGGSLLRPQTPEQQQQQPRMQFTPCHPISHYKLCEAS